MNDKKFNDAVASARRGDTDTLLSMLTPEQRAMLNKALTSKEEAEKLLSTPQAAALIKALSDKGGK